MNNNPTTKEAGKYVEPEEFLGTKGEWYVNDSNLPSMLFIDVDYNNSEETTSVAIAEIKTTEPSKEWLADAKLIAQSKNMAVCLQDLIGQSERIIALFNTLWFDKWGEYPDKCADYNDLNRKIEAAQSVLQKAIPTTKK